MILTAVVGYAAFLGFIMIIGRARGRQRESANRLHHHAK